MAATPDFGTARGKPDLRQKLATFWRWWTTEISRLLPEQLSLLRAGAGAPLLAVEGDEVLLLDQQGAAPPDRRVLAAALDEARRKSAVRSLLERAGETRGRARVALGREEALVRRVTLPAATEENLSQVLAFEMDRLSPFRAEEVYFDHRVVSRDATAGQIVVELAMARRDLVDARVQQLRAMDVSVQGVSLRDDAARGAEAFDLLPSEQRGARETRRERLVRFGLIGAVVALFLLSLVLPVWKKRQEVLAQHPQVAKAKQEAESTDAIVRELEKQAADYNFLLAKKYANYPAAAYLEEITRLMPDNTWIQQMDLKTAGKVREIQLTGETPSSSKLIELFEQSKVLQNAAPRGTVTRGAGPGTERFMIVAETRPRPLPDPQAVPASPGAAQATPPAPVQPPAPPAEPPPTAVVEPVPSSRP
jgi:general secretion pathway protein L